MTDRENKVLYIAEQLRKAGFTLAGAAGIIANIEAESAFKSTNVQDCYEARVGSDEVYTSKVDNGAYLSFATDSVGYGLCQWTASDRKQGMLAFHRNRKTSIGDFKTQVDWLIAEIKHYTRAYNTCTNSNDPYQCGYDVCKYYEIPADTENQANYRGNKARQWYNWLVEHMDDHGDIPDDPEPAPDPIPDPKTLTLRTIDYHCSGWDEVGLLQYLLRLRGYVVPVDAIWNNDDDTDKAVKAFQSSAKLKADGVVGDNTWDKLWERC